MNDFMHDEVKRPVELEQARELLRAIEPPDGAKQRIEQALLLQNGRDRARTGWRWGLGLAFLAATSAAAVGDYIPVRRILQVVQGEAAPSVEHRPAPQQKRSGVAVATPQVPPTPAVDPTEPTPVSTTGVEPPHAKSQAPRRHLTSKSAAATEPLPPSELALLVTEFEQAKALAKNDPARGLAAFRRLQQRWPHSPLRPEIDLQIVSLLNRLGKHEESQRESAAFVHEHPDNPRTKELEHALQAGGAGN